MDATYTNPEFGRFLQNLTKYASKPLGFNKIYQDELQLKKRGYKTCFFQEKNLFCFLILILF